MRRFRQPLLYATALALLLFALRWMEIRFMVIEHQLEVYVGFIALTFTGLGIWLARKLTKPRVETRIHTVILEKQPPAPTPFTRNDAERAHLTLSSRELEVLAGMAAGLSNQEIADQLCLSLNTVKTHAATLFGKLEVKRRTQAVEQARRLGILA